MTLDAQFVVRLGEFDLDVSITVAAGEVLAVLGPNGSGKSTLLRTIAGLVPLDTGRITIDQTVLDDTDTGEFVAPEQRSIGVVFQNYLLFEHLSALDNIAFGLRARGVDRREARRRAAEWLARLALSEHERSRPRTLSGGQAQRVALARALAIEPRALLLDEPLAALDVATRRQVRRDLRRHLADFEGYRILVTHDPVDAYALADRIAILEHGRVVQTGTIAQVTAHPRSRYVAELVGTNLVPGDVSGNVLVTSNGTIVAVVSDFNGPAFAIIRPQSITLSHAPTDTSARNSFTGVVDDIDRQGDRVRVGIDGPLHLTAEITTSALEALDLRPGDTITATVKATDIDTYPS